MHLELSS